MITCIKTSKHKIYNYLYIQITKNCTLYTILGHIFSIKPLQLQYQISNIILFYIKTTKQKLNFKINIHLSTFVIRMYLKIPTKYMIVYHLMKFKTCYGEPKYI